MFYCSCLSLWSKVVVWHRPDWSSYLWKTLSTKQRFVKAEMTATTSSQEFVTNSHNVLEMLHLSRTVRHLCFTMCRKTNVTTQTRSAVWSTKEMCVTVPKIAALARSPWADPENSTNSRWSTSPGSWAVTQAIRTLTATGVVESASKVWKWELWWHEVTIP